MSRLEPYIGFAAIFIFCIAAVVFLGKITIPAIPIHVVSDAFPNLSTLSGHTIPDITFLFNYAGTSVATTSAEQTAPIQSAEPPMVLAPVKIEEKLPEKIPEKTPLELSAITLRKALVNIICHAPSGSGLRSISGSGVIVSPTGIILTSAHIAQYFLLYDRNVSCTIRTGSPATDSYKASLIYISPAWINANATILTELNPIGTGEYDFALLAITKSATEAALPASFASIPLAIESRNIGTPVVIASYGAQSLGPSQIRSALFPTIVFGSVKDVFTFASTTIDVLALGGSAAAQEGSSGGGVADASSKLVGTITTSTIDGEFSSRSLVALTASYIRAEYARETGSSLDSLLAKPISNSVSDFAPVMPYMESIITAHLPD